MDRRVHLLSPRYARVSRALPFAAALVFTALHALFGFKLYAADRDDSRALFRAEADLNYDQLELLIRQLSPELFPLTRQAALAKLDVVQARMFANPTLDLAWGTVPVGRTTPKDLEQPLANVPNYGVGVGYTFPLAKRGPRQARATQWANAAEARVDLTARDLALALAAVLGDLATATMRHDGMLELVSGGEHSVELAGARLRATFGTPLEVDRLRVDVQRTRQLVRGVSAEIEDALAACSQLLGVRCRNFSDSAAARAYLTRWLVPELPDLSALQRRPDLRVLDASIAASRAEEALAAATAIPDPTVRVGYLHDRFVTSGNQRHSLNLSVALPLPIFERGQAQRRSAETARRLYAEERQRRLAAARARVPVLQQRLALQRERCTSVTEHVLPEARDVLRGLEHAVESRLLPLADVLLARRTVSELLLEEAESCGDAYQAALELARETPRKGS